MESQGRGKSSRRGSRLDTGDGRKPDAGKWHFSRVGKDPSGSSSGFSRAIRTTGLFFRRQLWVWPIVAGLLLAVVAWSVRGVVEESARKTIGSELESIVMAVVEALRIWFDGQERYVEAVAADDDIQRPVLALLEVASRQGSTAADLLLAPALGELRDELTPQLERRGYEGFAVLSSGGRFVAASVDAAVGRTDIELPERLLERVMSGETVITRPFKSPVPIAAGSRFTAGVATMVAAAPIQDDADAIVALLGLRISPQTDFTRILSIARPGESGETYAFDAAGLMISQSRFDAQLRQIGLLPDEDETRSILNVRLRDPGVNMTVGRIPAARRSELPLTVMASDAIGSDGRVRVNVEGYNDYRGVPVVGAWVWLREYGFGVATEIDVAEAYRPLYIVRYTFWGMYAALAMSALAIFVFTVVVARVNRSAQLAAIKARKLGQYTLEEKLGSGAMGVVYRGHHGMLRRPTAIKLLPPERTTEAAIARFEREVQLTSQLNHPNTIAIYDYGRTPEGVFYYAMEFLNGIDLDALIRKFGPMPAGRVIHVLRQICGSLAEAHDVGLVHRDVKPANIVLNQRGGLCDVVKVLDFGLVKAIDAQEQSALTVAGSIIGTPLYMAPEGVEDAEAVDARSYLYSVGAVGYFLVTARPLFEGKSIIEICHHQVSSIPVPPSERLGREVPRDLEEILLRCLEKDPAGRFQTARDLEKSLARAKYANAWSESDARAWWDSYTPTKVSLPPGPLPPESDAETFVLPGESEDLLP